MRNLLVLIIGLFFGAGMGFVIAGGTGTPAHDHAGHSDTAHDHTALAQWAGPPPTLDIALTQDLGHALNLQIIADGFSFAPEQVNGPLTQGTGHAHVYIDGVKYARAYGPWMHLAMVPAGATVRVTLNANNHSVWAIDGTPLAVQATAP